MIPCSPASDGLKNTAAFDATNNKNATTTHMRVVKSSTPNIGTAAYNMMANGETAPSASSSNQLKPNSKNIATINGRQLDRTRFMVCRPW
jgi:hypothetical protein